MLRLHFLNALTWSSIHYVGLGFLLKAQSQNRFLVHHFMKHYHYSSNDGGGAIAEAFTKWDLIYNLSMCMTY
ncbi:phosphatidylethanolamine N-methyltransferase, partial [Blastosporella zonata]